MMFNINDIVIYKNKKYVIEDIIDDTLFLNKGNKIKNVFYDEVRYPQDYIINNETAKRLFNFEISLYDYDYATSLNKIDYVITKKDLLLWYENIKEKKYYENIKYFYYLIDLNLVKTQKSEIGFKGVLEIVRDLVKNLDNEQNLKEIYHNIINLELPIEAKELNDEDKLYFIEQLKEKIEIFNENKIYLNLYKQFLEELVEKDNSYAKSIYAYEHYGNDKNSVYPCDFKKSLDIFLDLITKDDVSYEEKIYYYNTIGYIYYYGRTTNGVRNYEEAYKYFSLASLGNVDEATCKVCDILMNGRGIYNNKKLAFNILMDNFNRIINENNVFLANYLIRIGGCFENGYGTEKNINGSLYYYLYASYELEERKKFDIYGDDVLRANVARSINRLIKPCNCILNTTKANIYEYFYYILSYAYKIKIKKLKKCYKFSVYLKQNKMFIFPKYLTVVNKDYFNLYVYTNDELLEGEFECVDIIEDDLFIIETKEKEIEFYSDKIILNIKPIIKEEKDIIHKFVTVKYEGSNKEYDYLCDDIEVSIGDYVQVIENGEYLEVLDIKEILETETKIPFQYYKKVIKKLIQS